MKREDDKVIILLIVFIFVAFDLNDCVFSSRLLCAYAIQSRMNTVPY